MVFVKTKWGGFHEPPYTEAEILEFSRRVNSGVVAFKSHQHRQPPHRPNAGEDPKDPDVQMKT